MMILKKLYIKIFIITITFNVNEGNTSLRLDIFYNRKVDIVNEFHCLC